MHCTLPIYMGDKKTESVCESTAASGTQAHTDSYQSHQWLSETNVLSQIYHSPLSALSSRLKYCRHQLKPASYCEGLQGPCRQKQSNRNRFHLFLQFTASVKHLQKEALWRALRSGSGKGEVLPRLRRWKGPGGRWAGSDSEGIFER